MASLHIIFLAFVSVAFSLPVLPPTLPDDDISVLPIEPFPHSGPEFAYSPEHDSSIKRSVNAVHLPLHSLHHKDAENPDWDARLRCIFAIYWRDSKCCEPLAPDLGSPKVAVTSVGLAHPADESTEDDLSEQHDVISAQDIGTITEDAMLPSTQPISTPMPPSRLSRRWLWRTDVDHAPVNKEIADNHALDALSPIPPSPLRKRANYWSEVTCLITFGVCSKYHKELQDEDDRRTRVKQAIQDYRKTHTGLLIHRRANATVLNRESSVTHPGGMIDCHPGECPEDQHRDGMIDCYPEHCDSDHKKNDWASAVKCLASFGIACGDLDRGKPKHPIKPKYPLNVGWSCLKSLGQHCEGLDGFPTTKHDKSLQRRGFVRWSLRCFYTFGFKCKWPMKTHESLHVDQKQQRNATNGQDSSKLARRGVGNVSDSEQRTSTDIHSHLNVTAPLPARWHLKPYLKAYMCVITLGFVCADDESQQRPRTYRPGTVASASTKVMEDASDSPPTAVSDALMPRAIYYGESHGPGPGVVDPLNTLRHLEELRQEGHDIKRETSLPQTSNISTVSNALSAPASALPTPVDFGKAPACHEPCDGNRTHPCDIPWPSLPADRYNEHVHEELQRAIEEIPNYNALLDVGTLDLGEQPHDVRQMPEEKHTQPHDLDRTLGNAQPDIEDRGIDWGEVFGCELKKGLDIPCSDKEEHMLGDPQIGGPGTHWGVGHWRRTDASEERED